MGGLAEGLARELAKRRKAGAAGDEVFSKRDLRELILAKRADAMYAEALPFKRKAINAEFESFCFRALEESIRHRSYDEPLSELHACYVHQHIISIYPSGLYLLHSPPASLHSNWSYVFYPTGLVCVIPYTVPPVGVIPMNARFPYFPLLIDMQRGQREFSLRFGTPYLAGWY